MSESDTTPTKEEYNEAVDQLKSTEGGEEVLKNIRRAYSDPEKVWSEVVKQAEAGQ